MYFPCFCSFDRENTILESDDDDEVFYSILLAVAAHRTGTLLESCKLKKALKNLIDEVISVL